MLSGTRPLASSELSNTRSVKPCRSEVPDLGRARTAMMRYLTVRRVPAQISATEPACGDVHYVADGAADRRVSNLDPNRKRCDASRKGLSESPFRDGLVGVALGVALEYPAAGMSRALPGESSPWLRTWRADGCLRPRFAFSSCRRSVWNFTRSAASAASVEGSACTLTETPTTGAGRGGGLGCWLVTRYTIRSSGCRSRQQNMAIGAVCAQRRPIGRNASVPTPSLSCWTRSETEVG